MRRLRDHPDLRHHLDRLTHGQIRHGPLAGDYEGIAQVMEVLGKISELSGGAVQPELHDVLVSNDHTVALATMRAERSGKQFRLNLVHAIHSENGKATEVWTHSSDPAAIAEFWA